MGQEEYMLKIQIQFQHLTQITQSNKRSFSTCASGQFGTII